MEPAMQKIGKVAVVLAVVALLLGGLTIPAGAAPLRPGISEANDYILTCTAEGGDPVVVMDSTGENLTVLCRWPNGVVSVCQFLPVVKACQWVTPLKVSERAPGNGTRTPTK